MNLLDLMIKVGLKDEASGKAEGVASKVVGKAGATVAKAVGVGVAAVGAGVAAVTGMSMNAYAAYEQNVGGIQKIFGNMGKSLEDYAAMTGQTVEQCSGKWEQLEQAQTTVLANADRAYITAGLSANRYMEQVSGFSASLVKSLGGDTVKAAEYANTAMVDMSDNANTFGTAMEDLQNAYQGFAKQNYTMLDNLKLGYGGTKEEMQRLVKDAHAVNSAVDESSLSFDNVVLAIHTMQEQMQIAGTTSREAATTIEGSCNMAKAAWENWVTELSKDDADMGKLTEELLQSVETAASNVVPRVATIVGTALSQLPSLVTSVGPVLGQAFVDIFTQALDSAAEAVPGPMGDILSAVSDGVDEIGERFKGLVEIWAVGDNPLESLHLAMVYGLTLLEGDLSTLQENITSSLPGIAEGFADVGGEVVPRLAEGIEMGLSFLSETAASLMTSLGGYLSENLPSITESGLQILTGLSESIAENAGVLAEGAANLIVGLAQGIADSLPTLIEQAPVIVQNLASAINDNAPILLGRHPGNRDAGAWHRAGDTDAHRQHPGHLLGLRLGVVGARLVESRQERHHVPGQRNREHGRLRALVRHQHRVRHPRRDPEPAVHLGEHRPQRNQQPGLRHPRRGRLRDLGGLEHRQLHHGRPVLHPEPRGIHRLANRAGNRKRNQRRGGRGREQDHRRGWRRHRRGQEPARHPLALARVPQDFRLRHGGRGPRHRTSR